MKSGVDATPLFIQDDLLSARLRYLESRWNQQQATSIKSLAYCPNIYCEPAALCPVEELVSTLYG